MTDFLFPSWGKCAPDRISHSSACPGLFGGQADGERPEKTRAKKRREREAKEAIDRDINIEPLTNATYDPDWPKTRCIRPVKVKSRSICSSVFNDFFFSLFSATNNSREFCRWRVEINLPTLLDRIIFISKGKKEFSHSRAFAGKPLRGVSEYNLRPFISLFFGYWNHRRKSWERSINWSGDSNPFLALNFSERFVRISRRRVEANLPTFSGWVVILTCTKKITQICAQLRVNRASDSVAEKQFQPSHIVLAGRANRRRSTEESHGKRTLIEQRHLNPLPKKKKKMFREFLAIAFRVSFRFIELWSTVKPIITLTPTCARNRDDPSTLFSGSSIFEPHTRRQTQSSPLFPSPPPRSIQPFRAIYISIINNVSPRVREIRE